MTTNLKLFLVSCLPLLAVTSYAEDFEWAHFGLRAGVDAESDVSINSYELFAVLESPWEWAVSEAIEIELGFEFGLGALDGEGETSLFGHAGPMLEIEFGDFPLELIISSGTALLSEHEFDHLDLGGSFQFVSAIGFDLEVVDDWILGYRFHHISNTGLYDRNPGLDLHSLSLSVDF